jgi:hypothetical protein
MNSASLCSLAGLYDNRIPPRFLAPIDFLKIPAQYCMLTLSQREVIQAFKDWESTKLKTLGLDG